MPRRAGFTLVESLIASVVLAVAVVGISGTIAAAYQQSRQQVSVGHTAAAAADFKRVTVTVTRPDAAPIVLTKYFTRATLAI